MHEHDIGAVVAHTNGITKETLRAVPAGFIFGLIFQPDINQFDSTDRTDAAATPLGELYISGCNGLDELVLNFLFLNERLVAKKTYAWDSATCPVVKLTNIAAAENLRYAEAQMSLSPVSKLVPARRLPTSEPE